MESHGFVCVETIAAKAPVGMRSRASFGVALRLPWCETLRNETLARSEARLVRLDPGFPVAPLRVSREEEALAAEREEEHEARVVHGGVEREGQGLEIETARGGESLFHGEAEAEELSAFAGERRHLSPNRVDASLLGRLPAFDPQVSLGRRRIHGLRNALSVGGPRKRTEALVRPAARSPDLPSWGSGWSGPRRRSENGGSTSRARCPSG